MLGSHVPVLSDTRIIISRNTRMIYRLQGTKSSKSFTYQFTHFSNPGTEVTAGYTIKNACPLLKSQLQDPGNEAAQ